MRTVPSSATLTIRTTSLPITFLLQLADNYYLGGERKERASWKGKKTEEWNEE